MVANSNRRIFNPLYHPYLRQTHLMNQHQLKDEINKTHREKHEYESDLSTEKDPVRKEFLEKKVKELKEKYTLLTNKQE